MVLDVLLFLTGLALLYYGAEWLVRGSANVAMALGVTPMVVGLTVVAFGTSAPEVVASLVAVINGSPDIALGNVIGSNIANVGLVLACGALLYPLKILRSTRAVELPFMVGFTILLLVFCIDGLISRVDGGILLACVIGFTGYCLLYAKKGEEDEKAMEDEVQGIAKDDGNLAKEILITVVGIAGVVLGAYLLVDSATSIARAFGVSELVIGVTIVAVGTSLPELATTAIASIRKQADIAVGNIIGSNIFNIGLVLGVTSLVEPLTVLREILTNELVIMATFSAALIPLTIKLSVGRVAGGALLIGYVVFLWRAIV